MSRQKHTKSHRKSVGKFIRYHRISKMSKAFRKAMKNWSSYKRNRNGRQYSCRLFQDTIANCEFPNLSGDIEHPKSDDYFASQYKL